MKIISLVLKIKSLRILFYAKSEGKIILHATLYHIHEIFIFKKEVNKEILNHIIQDKNKVTEI